MLTRLAIKPVRYCRVFCKLVVTNPYLMRKFLAILFFVISGILTLLALLTMIRVLFLNGHHYTNHDARDFGYQLGYIIGSFIVPGILVWIAFFLIKRGRKLLLPKTQAESVTTPPSL
jgi:cytosine/uracil/thiamine/allantoin permease